MARNWMRRMYPEEKVVLVVLGFVLLAFSFYPFSVIWFDPQQSIYIVMRLALPAVFFWMVRFFQLTLRKPVLPHALRVSAWETLRVWVVLYLALVVHTNVKINIGLFNPALYDVSLFAIDNWILQFASPVTMLASAHAWLNTRVDVTQYYITVYELMFMISFIVHYLKDHKQFRVMFAATIFTLFVGTGVYVLLPALGPFIYVLPQSPYMQHVVNSMLDGYIQYNASSGALYQPGMIIQGLAAMPSLHIANAFVFVWFAYKYARRLLWLYIPALVFIAVEAVYTRLHYTLDLVIGLEIAVIGIVLATGIYQLRDQKDKAI